MLFFQYQQLNYIPLFVLAFHPFVLKHVFCNLVFLGGGVRLILFIGPDVVSENNNGVFERHYII